jgi:hypothetical protein
MNRRVFCLALAVAATAAGMGLCQLGSVDQQHLLRPRARAILDALRLPTGSTRSDAFTHAVCAALSSDDQETVRQAVAVVGYNDRWLDATWLESALKVLPVDNPQYLWLQRVIDERRFAVAPRSFRLSAYQEAIVTGSARMGPVARVLRPSSMGSAALEGLSELMPAIEEHHNELPEAWKAHFPLEMLRWQAKLGEGAETLEEAITLASSRLLDLAPAVFLTNFTESDGFSLAVTRYADYACRRGPLMDTIGSACANLRKLYQRGVATQQDRESASPRVGAGERAPQGRLPRFRDLCFALREGENCTLSAGK